MWLHLCSRSLFPRRGRLRSLFLISLGASVAGFCVLPPPSFAQTRLDLQQSHQAVTLSQPARQSLESALQAFQGDAPHMLAAESAAAVIANLPGEFRRSCVDMLQNWGSDASAAARWDVRVLFSFPSGAAQDVILALRCSAPGVEASYDERPAFVSLSPASATLTLVPLAEDCSNCSELYRVEFSQSLPGEGARLVELSVSYTSDNPCCGGPDTKDGKRRMIFAFPAGQVASAANAAFTGDELAHWSSGDAEDPNGGAERVCHTTFDYGRDAAGDVNAVSLTNRCTQTGKPAPDIKKRIFRWNGKAFVFDGSK
jgi:hypothetical protein